MAKMELITLAVAGELILESEIRKSEIFMEICISKNIFIVKDMPMLQKMLLTFQWI
jgi:hypothetical protein